MPTWVDKNDNRGAGIITGVIVVGFVIIVAAMLIVAVQAIPSRADVRAHVCDSPCVVYLPDNTQEDGWYVDYGWIDRGTPVLGVHVCPQGDMSGRCG